MGSLAPTAAPSRTTQQNQKNITFCQSPESSKEEESKINITQSSKFSIISPRFEAIGTNTVEALNHTMAADLTLEDDNGTLDLSKTYINVVEGAVEEQGVASPKLPSLDFSNSYINVVE